MLTVSVHYRTGMVETVHGPGRVSLNGQGQFHDLCDLSQKGPALPAPSWEYYPKIIFVT